MPTDPHTGPIDTQALRRAFGHCPSGVAALAARVDAPGLTCVDAIT